MSDAVEDVRTLRQADMHVDAAAEMHIDDAIRKSENRRIDQVTADLLAAVGLDQYPADTKTGKFQRTITDDSLDDRESTHG